MIFPVHAQQEKGEDLRLTLYSLTRSVLTMEKLIGPHFFENINLKSVKDVLLRACDSFTDDIAIVYREDPQEDPIEVHYHELRTQVLRATQMLAHRAGADSIPFEELRVAVQGENSYPWIISYFAPLMGKAMVVPLDRLLGGSETASLLQRSRSQVYIADAHNFVTLEDELENLSNLKVVYLMLEERLRGKNKAKLEAMRERATFPILNFWDELTIERAEALIEEPDTEAAQVLLFTSGTTAMAKGVLLSQYNLAANVNQLMGSVELERGIKLLSILPLNHSFENTCGLLTGMSFGGRLHICDGLRYISKNLQEYEIDMLIAVPAIFEAVWRRIEQTIEREGKQKKFQMGLKISRILRKVGIDLRRRIFKDIHAALGGLYLAIVGAAPMSKELIELYEDVGVRLLQGYGLTEAAPVVMGCNSVVFVPGTVGVPLAGVEVAIDNEAPGEPGEILVKGDNVTKFGYYEDPEETAAILPGDGWLHTGDLGAIDPDSGCVKITGRIKSMIVLESGKKVYPEEVEHLLNEYAHDLIRQALVFGSADDKGEVTVSAKFVLDPEKLKALKDQGFSNIEDALHRLVEDVNKVMPPFKRIRTWFYSFKDMVSTTTMKIRRSVEEENIKHILEDRGLRIRDLNRRNVDELDDPSFDTADIDDTAVIETADTSDEADPIEVTGHEVDTVEVDKSRVEDPKI